MSLWIIIGSTHIIQKYTNHVLTRNRSFYKEILRMDDNYELTHVDSVNDFSPNDESIIGSNESSIDKNSINHLVNLFYNVLL